MEHNAIDFTTRTGKFRLKFSSGQTRLVVLLLIVVYIILRLPNLGESLWYDEVDYATNYWAVSLSALWKLFLFDPHAPLYQMFMFFWTRFFGEHELSVRLPSLLFGISSIILTYRIATTYGTRKMATLASFLLCISPVHVWYSQEATPYSMALCFLLATVYVLRRLSAGCSHRVWYVVYPGFLLVAVFTHYYAAIFMLPLSLMALSAERSVRRRIITAHCVVVLCLVSALGVKYMNGQINYGLSFLRPFTLFEWWMLFLNWFSHGNSLWTVNPYRGASIGLQYLVSKPLLLVYQSFFLAILLRGILPHRGRNGWSQTCELSLYLFALPLVMLLLTQIGYRNLYIERYLFFVLPFFLIVLARGATGFSNTKSTTVCILAVVIFGMASYGAFLYKSETWTVYKQNPDWRSAACYLSIENNAPEESIVVMVTPVDGLIYYLRKEGTEQYPVIMLNTTYDIFPILKTDKIKTIYLIRNHYWRGVFDIVFQRLIKHRSFRLVQLAASRSFNGLDVYTFIRYIERREKPK